MNEKIMPTQDDKLISALAHGAVLLPMWGLIASALIWVTQREKSAFVRQQAAQAIAWQVALIAVFMLGMGCYMASFFLLIGGAALTNGFDGAAGPPPFFFIPVGVMGLIFVMFFVFIIGGVWAAVRNLQGRPFRYPLIGAWVESFLAK